MISGQENINIGAPNQASGSDTLYSAFNKVQNNFTQLFGLSSPVTTAVSGDGINASVAGNTLTVTNTGVTNIIAGTNIVIDQSNGNVTISSTGGGGGGSGGTVTSVGVSSGTLAVTNSPIVSAGLIGINLPLQPNLSLGTYTNPNVTVDSYGRITNISNGASGGTVTSVAVTGGSGINVTGSPITNNGTITITNTGVTKLNAGSGIGITAATGEITISSTLTNLGTVTSVAVTSNSLAVTGSPVISAGTITVELPSNVAVTGSTTVGTFLRLTPSTAPASPTAGMVYYDSVMNKLRLYNGTSWGNITVT